MDVPDDVIDLSPLTYALTGSARLRGCRNKRHLDRRADRDIFGQHPISGLTVQNNIIQNAFYHGIDVFSVSDLTIQDNLIQGNGNDGIKVGGGAGVFGATIRYNHFIGGTAGADIYNNEYATFAHNTIDAASVVGVTAEDFTSDGGTLTASCDISK